MRNANETMGGSCNAKSNDDEVKVDKKVGVDEAVEYVTIALGSQASNFSKTS